MTGDSKSGTFVSRHPTPAVLEKPVRMLAVVLSLICLSHPVLALPDADQRAWFDGLSPDEAAEVFQAYEDRQRMARWDAVTVIAVTDMVRTTDIRFMKPTDILPWNARVASDSKVKVWWAVEMPRKSATPFDLEVRWFHEGKEIRMQTFGIDKPSPHYRLWDTLSLKRLGTWTIRITSQGRTLATNTLYVD